jgi:hypothetical protein
MKQGIANGTNTTGIELNTTKAAGASSSSNSGGQEQQQQQQQEWDPTRADADN